MVDKEALFDELEKIGRSYVSDLVGGIDPTGGATFRYGMEDVEQGRKGTGTRKALGAVGGVIGGAAVVPSAISGLIGGVKGLSSGGGGGVKGRLMRAGRGFTSGLVAPFKKVYQATRAGRGLKAMQAGRDMSRGQARALRGLASGMPGLGAASQVSASQVQQLAKNLPPEQLAKLRAGVGGQLTSGLATLGTSGLIGGGSAYLQYGKGRAAAQKYQGQIEQARAQGQKR